VAAYSGEQALQIAAGFHPDYLLADVLMPFMNGVDLAIAIRKMSLATRSCSFPVTPIHLNCWMKPVSRVTTST
jgi:CheY-like chemotaxis protein